MNSPPSNQVPVKIPAMFYLDRVDRVLPSPAEIKTTKRNVWIDLNDQRTPELLSDAEHRVKAGSYPNMPPGLVASARATVKAIKAAQAAASRKG